MKTFLILMVHGFTSSILLGQATFELRNYIQSEPIGFGRLNAPVFDSNGNLLTGPTYRVELYGNIDPNRLEPALNRMSSRLSLPFFTGIGASYFGTHEGVFIPGVVGNGAAWLQIRAWDTRLGSTYEEAAARGLGGFGESPLFHARGGDPDRYVLPQPLIGLQSFRLRPVTSAVLLRGIRQEGDQLLVEWHPGFHHYQLQQTSVLGAAWEDVGAPTTSTSMAIPTTGNAQFFRVVGFLAEDQENNDENESPAKPPE